MAKNTKKQAPPGKRYTAQAAQVDKDTLLDVVSAIAKAKELANAKFVESVDVSLKLGIDPRKSDQNVRGITNLPHGTGKKMTVAVLAKGDLAREAEAAGADFVGDDDLIKKIQEGWKGFDVMLATNDMAPQIGKVGRFLGPKTPNKRNGTVTDAIGQAVKEIKSASRVEYRTDKAGIVHVPIGRVNFTDEQLQENFIAALDAVIKAKPSSSKGRYLRTVTVSSTMGPGIPVDPTIAGKFAGH